MFGLDPLFDVQGNSHENEQTQSNHHHRKYLDQFLVKSFLSPFFVLKDIVDVFELDKYQECFQGVNDVHYNPRNQIDEEGDVHEGNNVFLYPHVQVQQPYHYTKFVW